MTRPLETTLGADDVTDLAKELDVPASELRSSAFAIGDIEPLMCVGRVQHVRDLGNVLDQTHSGRDSSTQRNNSASMRSPWPDGSTRLALQKSWQGGPATIRRTSVTARGNLRSLIRRSDLAR